MEAYDTLPRFSRSNGTNVSRATRTEKQGLPKRSTRSELAHSGPAAGELAEIVALVEKPTGASSAWRAIRRFPKKITGSHVRGVERKPARRYTTMCMFRVWALIRAHCVPAGVRRSTRNTLPWPTDASLLRCFLASEHQFATRARRTGPPCRCCVLQELALSAGFFVLVLRESSR